MARLQDRDSIKYKQYYYVVNRNIQEPASFNDSAYVRLEANQSHYPIGITK